MSYQVLARRWRPQDFDSVVGQVHVRTALRNALTQQRLHHAYLFTGTRGTGKTTIARILAKCLNCQTGITATPCQTCSACVALDQGHCPDFIEVDAASRTKVEDTRDLLNNVPYAPMQCRFKIYLIDEVHMLSGHSFNALLKTLEEPPEHVKFLLATTEPQRLPITVLSRCLQFNLKTISTDDISNQLIKILTAEQIPFENTALRQIAIAAEGSMRDALSILDQAIMFGNGHIKTTEISQLLGTIHTTPLLQILQALAHNDGVSLLQCVDQIAAFNPDYAQTLAQLLQLLHQLMLRQCVPEYTSTNTNFSEEESLELDQLSQQFSKESVQLLYQIALHGRRDLALTADAKMGFSITLLRMLSFNPLATEHGNLDMGNTKPKVTTVSHEPKVTPTQSRPMTIAAPASMPADTMRTSSSNLALTAENWPAIIKQLKISGMTSALANHCQFIEQKKNQLSLALASKHAALHSKAQEQQLEQALRQYLSNEIVLEIKINDMIEPTPVALTQSSQAHVQKTATQDPHLQALMDTFNATISVTTKVE